MDQTMNDWFLFWDKVEKSATHWFWIAATNGKYGHFRRRGKDRLAHRQAYEFCVRKIPKGKTIDHLCDFPLCVNPAHLRVATNYRNNARKRKVTCGKGHLLRGKNLYRWRGGTKQLRRVRQCRECHRLREAKRREILR